MNLLFFTDLHLDNWSAFATTTLSGYNSRLTEQIYMLEHILQYAEKYKCDIIFGGDFFNRRMLIPSEAIHMAWELFNGYRQRMIYLLVGNHDMYTWNSDSTPLLVFDTFDHVRVITEPTELPYEGYGVSIFLVPHGALIPASSASLREEGVYQVLVTHYGVSEARLGPKDFRMKEDLTVKKLKELEYDLIMLGHIHKPQALSDDIIVMGSPMAHSFHETDEEKYFYILDMVTKVLVKYPTGAPKFLTHDIKDMEDLVRVDINDGNYHRINVLSDKITFSDLNTYTGTKSIITKKPKETKKTIEITVEKIESRTPKDEIEDYYNSIDTELDRDRLKKKSLQFIGEV